MKWILKFIVWLAILLMGLYAIFYFTVRGISSTSGYGFGTGVVSYQFAASSSIWGNPEMHDATFGSIRVNGEHPARFMLWGNVSPKYRSAELKWNLFGHKNSKGEAVVDLQRMIIHANHESIPLSVDSLAGLLGHSQPTAQVEHLSIALFEFLEAAGDGGLPRPSHHGHSLPEPLPGHLSHSATGMLLAPIELAWLVGWVAIGLLHVIKTRKSTRPVGNKTSAPALG